MSITHLRPSRASAWLISIALLCVVMVPGAAAVGMVRQESLVPILGVTLEDQRPIGTVANLLVVFKTRADHSGLSLHFLDMPGRFSPMAQTAVQQAIIRSARAAGLPTDAWTVLLGVPYPGLTIYGTSLSAMVALSVVAMAKDDVIPADRVITGMISPEGHITPVGGISLKIQAAYEAHLRRVVVPSELDIADNDWRTPFLVQVSPVGTISEAYQALTDHPLRPPTVAASDSSREGLSSNEWP